MGMSLKTFGKHRYLLFAFWYLALFPGRLGYDYALLARMVQKGESTAWWGANFYWIFRFLTFGGEHLFLISLISLSLLTYSIYFFIWSLPIKLEYRRKALTVLMITPIYGFFGLTVSHDVFQTSGVLLASALLFRWKFDSEFRFSKAIPVIGISVFSLLTTHTGIAIVLYLVIIILVNREVQAAIITVALTGSILFLSNFGIQEPGASSEFADKVPRASGAIPILLLIDLKCIVQHPDAAISDGEWIVLEKYSPRKNWLEKTTCSNPDAMLAPLKLDRTQVKLDQELVRTFISIVSRSPAIPFVSHIQRSAVALPPPFFLPPVNQIPWDTKIPLGEGTNVALQIGPEVLHPSIDEPSLAKKISLFAPLEVIAQTMALLINQASWFWGWGGLWLWSIYIFLIFRIRVLKSWESLVLTMPTLLLHLSIFAIGPSSLPRYVMATIFQGLIFTYLIFAGRKVID